MDESVGKPQRVAGFFVWMVGAGIALDGGHANVAGALLALGSILFLWGAAIGRREASALAPFRGDRP